MFGSIPGRWQPAVWLLAVSIPCGAFARPPQAPPAAPTPVVRAAPMSSVAETAPDVLAPPPAGWYSIGDPTDEEQLMLEYINRARANANAEAMRFFNTTDPVVLESYDYFAVDLAMMTNEFAALPQALPPLSFNARLNASARLHSQDMVLNNFQDHYSSTNPPPPNQPGDDMADRAGRQGYPWNYIAENVYAFADSPWYAHVGFDVDWGGGPGGMQNPRGHRLNIHDDVYGYREAGIGILLTADPGASGNVGPCIVTEDFARIASPKPFITGVAYFDLNGNGFYDIGEGYGGVTVTSPGSVSGAVTAVSGGYSIPVTTNGTYAMNFAAAGRPDFTTSVVVTGGANRKLDYIPAYIPPSLAGPLLARTGDTNAYALQPLAGATNHAAIVTRLSTNGFFEGAENGTNRLRISSAPGYNVIQSDVYRSGSRALHLTHLEPPVTSDPPINPIVEIDRAFFCDPGARLDFGSRLRWSSQSQTARVDVAESLDGNEWGSWTTLYAQPGSDSAGESGFTMRNVSLASRAGRFVRLRFIFNFHSGSYYQGVETHFGWLVDDIQLSNAREVTAQEQRTIGPAGLNWVPATDGSYLLQVRGTYGRRTYPWSSPMAVTATSLRFQLESIAGNGGGPIRAMVRATGATPSNLWLESSATPGGSYTAVPGLAPSNTAPGQYRFDYTPVPADTNLFLRAAGR